MTDVDAMKEPGWFSGIDSLTTLILPFAATYLFTFFVVEDAPVKMLAVIQVDAEQWYPDQRAPWEHSFSMFLGFSVAYLLFGNRKAAAVEKGKSGQPSGAKKEDEIEEKVEVGCIEASYP